MAFKSTKSKDYVSQINNLEKPTYESQYNSMISDSLSKIVNKEPFSYDFNADSLYQNYKDQYTKLGKEAALNAAASVSGLTGGYGNSYGAVAASQANQAYLTKLNDKIPELYNAALQKYQMELDNNYKQLSALQSEENRQYGIHRDDVSDYYTDWANLENGFQSALNQENWLKEFEYQQQRDAVADSQWQQTFNYNVSRANASDAQWQKQYDYQTQRDAVADSQWQQTFDTKNSQWQKEYELALKKARSGGSSGSGTGKKSANTLSNGYEVDLTNNNYAAVIRELVTDAYNRNDWSEDLVAEYINKLKNKGAIDAQTADKLYQNALYLYPQYQERVGRAAR